MSSRRSRWQAWGPFAFVLLTTVATTRIVLTYPSSYQTNDEPFHVGCGLRWLEGRYDYGCADQPPLSRIAIALPLYLNGVRATRFSESAYVEGSASLRGRGNYERDLALARLGALPFFWLASLATWLWGRRLFGDAPALVAVFLFQGLPLVLAHAGLATTDMAITGLLAGTLYALLVWLERPSFSRSTVLGVAVALSVLSKHSSILFLPATMFSVAAVALRRRQGGAGANQQPVIRPASLAVITASALLIVWAGYRFQSVPLTSAEDRPHRVGRLVGIERFQDPVREAFFRVVEMPIPAGRLLEGISLVRARNAEGVGSYFLGEFREQGTWYFFPGIIALKTPIAFLILSFLGGAILVRRAKGPRHWERFTPLACAVAILLVVLPARYNLGARHVLPMFPMLAILAGFALHHLATVASGKVAARATALVLAAWFVVASVRAHPDYLSSFNELVPHPERIVVDSDLDWGQDVKRLLAALQERGSREAFLRCLGCGYLMIPGLTTVHGAVGLRELRPYERVTGWIAVSEWVLRVENEKLRDPNRLELPFDWLRSYGFTRIGKSIRLYQIPTADREKLK